MEKLLHYATNVQLETYKSPGKFYDAMYLHEESYHGEQFLPMHISDEFKVACTSKDTSIYKLVLEVVSKHGRPSYHSGWSFTPKLTDFWIGFLGTSFEEVLAAALKYCEDNTDHSLEPTVYVRGSFSPTIQPLVLRNKTYPHYLDDKNV